MKRISAHLRPRLLYSAKKRGFTLIEILVVVSIIGVLSSVVISSVNAARTKAKVGQRNAVVKQLVNALELHYSEYGGYPYPPHTAYATCIGKLDDEPCSEGLDSLEGDTQLTTRIGQFINIEGIPDDEMEGGFLQNNVETTGVMGAFVYDPGVLYDGDNTRYKCTPSIQLCDAYQLRWYVPGTSQSCGLGIRMDCGDSPYWGAIGFTKCVLNVPSRSDYQNNC